MHNRSENAAFGLFKRKGANRTNMATFRAKRSYDQSLGFFCLNPLVKRAVCVDQRSKNHRNPVNFSGVSRAVGYVCYKVHNNALVGAFPA